MSTWDVGSVMRERNFSGKLQKCRTYRDLSTSEVSIHGNIFLARSLKYYNNELEFDAERRRSTTGCWTTLKRHEVKISPFVVLSSTGKLHFSCSRKDALVCSRYGNVPSQFQTLLYRRRPRPSSSSPVVVLARRLAIFSELYCKLAETFAQ